MSKEIWHKHQEAGEQDREGDLYCAAMGIKDKIIARVLGVVARGSKHSNRYAKRVLSEFGSL